MSELRAITLASRDVERSLAFYRDRLKLLRSRNAGEIALRFEPVEPKGPLFSGHEREEGYWKIGVTVPDVDQARERLVTSGVEVSEPAQFEDIGYLCHLRDPDGHTIELLQRGPTADPSPTLAHVTLRCLDIEACLAFYRDELGLRLLSVQPVSKYGFTLYFLAFTDESPPDPDLEAVTNREWLWRRPYTLLELQHLHEAPEEGALRHGRASRSGFLGLRIRSQAARALRDPEGAPIFFEAG